MRRAAFTAALAAALATTAGATAACSGGAAPANLISVSNGGCEAKGPNGAWLSVSALSLSQRQQIDAGCSQALEELAPIAVITEPRRT